MNAATSSSASSFHFERPKAKVSTQVKALPACIQQLASPLRTSPDVATSKIVKICLLNIYLAIIPACSSSFLSCAGD